LSHEKGSTPAIWQEAYRKMSSCANDLGSSTLFAGTTR
jgi:hypothetical protein